MTKQCEYLILDLIGSRAQPLVHEADMTSSRQLVLLHCDDHYFCSMCMYTPRPNILAEMGDSPMGGDRVVEGGKLLRRLVMQS
jgi:hypothetical protein